MKNKNSISVQGHGTIKKLRTGAVVSVLALSTVFGVATGNSSVVSASEVSTEGVTTTAVTSEEGTPVETTTAEATTEEKDSNYLVVVPKEPTVTVTEAQVEEAKKEVEGLASEVATAESAVQSLNSTITKLENEITSTNSELETVNSVTPEQVAEVKSELSVVEGSVISAEANVLSAESTVGSTSESRNQAADNVTSATAEVATAEATVKALEDKISSLEKNSTSDIPTLEAEIQSKEGLVEEGKAKVAQAEVALETARKATTDKEKAVEEQKTAVANAEIVVDSAAKTYSDALTAKEGTEKALNDAKSALDTAKAGTVVTETVQTGETTSTVGGKTTLNPDVAYSTWYEHNGVLTNSKYLTAIKNLANGTGTVEDVKNAIKSGFYGMETDSLDDLNSIAAPDGAAFESWTEVSEFSFKDTDYTTLVDVRNLTEEQRTELTQFYVALVNDLRSKVGTEPLVVTADSVKVADDTVTSIFNKAFPHYTGMSQEEMSADGFWNTMDGLNLETGQSGATPLKLGSPRLNIMDAVAQSTNGNLVLGWETGNAVQYPNNDGRKQSMATLKHNLLAVLGVQLYGTSGDGSMGEAYGGLNGTRSSNFDTALAVLGLNGNSYNSVGVDFEHLGTFNGFVDRAPKTFVVFSKSDDSPISNPYETVTGGSTTTTPVYETVSRTVVDEEKVAQAQKAYDDALTSDTEAQRVVDEAKTAYETAQQSYGEAQTQLNNLIAGTVDIKSLEEDLNTAVAELQGNEVSLKSSKELLVLSQSSKVEKDAALKVAREDLKDAKEVLSLKQQALTDATNALTLTTNAYEVAKLALDEARKGYNTAVSEKDALSRKVTELEEILKVKDETVKTLTEKLSNLKSELTTAKSSVEVESKTLTELKSKLKEAETQYNTYLTTKSEEDKQVAEYLRLSKLSDKEKEILSNGGTPKLVYATSDNTTIVDVVDADALEVVGDNIVKDTNTGEVYEVKEDGSLVVVPKVGDTTTPVSPISSKGNLANGTKVNSAGMVVDTTAPVKGTEGTNATNGDSNSSQGTLPRTGDAGSILATLVGSSALAGLAFTSRKKRK